MNNRIRFLYFIEFDGVFCSSHYYFNQYTYPLPYHMSPLVQRHIAFRRPQSVGMPRHALRRRMANGAMPAVFTAVAARWAGVIPQQKLRPAGWVLPDVQIARSI